jgi:hypothetical protein
MMKNEVSEYERRRQGGIRWKCEKVSREIIHYSRSHLTFNEIYVENVPRKLATNPNNNVIGVLFSMFTLLACMFIPPTSIHLIYIQTTQLLFY